MKIQKLVALFILTGFLTTQVMANEPASIIQFVRPLGMGGAFTAVADDSNVFNYNPAGMVQRTGGQATILEIAVGASEGTKEAYDFINDNKDDLKNFDQLTSQEQTDLTNKIINDISKLDPRIYVAADVASYVSGPKFLGLPLHAGFGAFGVADARFRLDAGVLVPTVSYSVNNDIVIPLSVAHRWEPSWLKGKIGVGATAKLIQRNQVKQDRISVLQVDNLESPPITKGRGYGADVGLLYQPTTRTNFGLMVRDFLGTKMKFDATALEGGIPAQPSRETVIRPQTNFGVALIPNKILWLLPTSDRWTFSADIEDMLNKDDDVFGDNLYTHLHLGAEYRWWFFRFRGGANQGYPTLGLGLDIPIIKIDYAYYSRELGEHAGDRREENHIISLALRFGSGYTESRERIAKSKDMKKGKDAVAEPDAMSATEAVPAGVPEAAPAAAPAVAPAAVPEVTPAAAAAPAATKAEKPTKKKSGKEKKKPTLQDSPTDMPQ